MRWGLVTIVVCVGALCAHDVQNYADGKAFSAGQPTSLTGNKTDVPGFRTDTPPEAGLGGEGLQDRAHSTMAGDGAGASFFKESRAGKLQIKIRPDDAIIRESDRILSDPEGALEETEIEDDGEGDGDKETITCTEPSEPLEIETTQHITQVPGVERKRLYVRTDRNDGVASPDVPPEPREWSVDVLYSRVIGYAQPRRGDGNCNGGAWNCLTETAVRKEPRHIYPLYDFYERPVLVDISTGSITPTGEWIRVEEGYHEKTNEFGERAREHVELKELSGDSVTWSSIDGFEAAVDQGDCEEVSVTCVEGGETRTIGGKDLHQDCWAYRYNYLCKGDTPDTCGACRARTACRQISSSCARRVEGRCVAFTQIFECTKGAQKFKRVRLSGDHPFCLDGSCHKVGWTPNGDFAAVVGKLNVLQEAAKEMDGSGHVVFKGKQMNCVRHRLGHKNCCNKRGGWGGACSGAELAHQIPRREGKCVKVGTFVAEKKLGVWTRKKTSFCCFGSKLSRIIQEQGRAQLGIGWGDPKHPSCRALSFDELSRIDFDRLNLSELFSEVMARVRVPDVGSVARDLVHDWHGRLAPQSVTDADSPAAAAGAAHASPAAAVPGESSDIRRIVAQRRLQLEGKSPREHTLNHEGGDVPGGAHAQLVF